MTYNKTIEVKESNQLTIDLPDEFKMKKVRITIEDIDSVYEEKIKMLKSASKDPLFVSDVNEIINDFNIIDTASGEDI
jgi:hypothetical protein